MASTLTAVAVSSAGDSSVKSPSNHPCLVSVDSEFVVFAGEDIKCHVTLTNQSDESIVVAWCSAHIHCNCTTSRSKLKIFQDDGAEKKRFNLQQFAFTPTRGERGHSVLETQTSVLCCDLQLAPHESNTYTYESTLPLHAPPTHRGEMISYTYKVAVGLQLVGSPAELTRWPFRVLPVTQELNNACRRESALLASSSRNSSGSGVARRETAVGGGSLSDATRKMLEPGILGGKEVPVAGASPRSTPEVSARAQEGSSMSDGMLSPHGTGADVGEAAPERRAAEAQDPRDAGGVVSSRDYADDNLATPTRPSTRGPAGYGLLVAPTTATGVDHTHNPFVTQTPSSTFSRQRILHAISSLSRRRHPSIFKVGADDGVVVLLYLAKPVYRVGEDVVGWLDFGRATTTCYQVTMTLETRESIPLEYWRNAADGGSPRRVAQAHKTVFCRNLTTVPILLPIPVASSPEFESQFVNVSWGLSFEFLIGVGEEAVVSVADTQSDGGNKKHVPDKVTAAPTEVAAKRLTWSLPVSVLPTNPVNVPSSHRLPHRA
eukprot:m.515953 g.515953  ORF g.515953 m.515953 type:complete len:546 (-) comp21925_c0_seq2:178-1815(-)